MSRIIAGAFGGRRLQAPPGRGTRPTSDRVREAMFNRLEHLGAVRDAQVLDLYAGSGALGLEALSRGAASAVFVEADRRAARLIEHNAALLGVRSARVLATSVRQALARTPGAPVHLALMDPPYDAAEAQVSDDLAYLADGGWLSPEAVLMVERSSRSPEPIWPCDCALIGPRRYGETTCWFAEYVPDGIAM